MKKAVLLFAVFLISTFSAVSQANNFYVCDSNGDDSFDGKSEAKPFKSYDKAIGFFNKLEAGEKLLFCRGGKFPASTQARLYNKNCSADKPCVIGAYGDESKDRPLIIPNKTNGINFENGGGARPDGGYVVENLMFISNSYSHSGIRFYNDVDDVTVRNVHLEGFHIGFYIAGANAVAEGSGSDRAYSRITFTDSTIIKNKKQGMLGSCSDCVVENNHFENNGTHPALDHNIYLAVSGEMSKGMIVRNNTLYRSAIVDDKCQGVSLVGHGRFEDLLIDGNTIKEDLGKVAGGCWGISIDPGYGNSEEYFKNVTIRKNKIINVGSNAIGCASCDGVLIEDNEIIDEGGLTMSGISVPVRGEDSVKSRDVVIKNNRIIVNHESAVGVTIGGDNPAVVRGNHVTLPTKTRKKCFERFSANEKVDVTSNLCKTHNGVSINDDLQKSGTELEENSVTGRNPEVVTDSGVAKPIYSRPGTSPVRNPTESVASNEREQRYTRSPVTSPAEPVVSKEDTTTSTTPSTGRRVASGSSASTTGSTSSTSNVTETSVSETVANISVPTYQRAPVPAKSAVTDKVEVVQASTYTRAPVSNSNSSITVKEVHEASQIDYSNVEATQCRAYSGSRCLMR